VPLLFENEADYDHIEINDRIEIPEVRSNLAQRSALVALNKTKEAHIPLRLDLSDRDIQILLKGGELNYYRA
jgi:aconitate hydratase